MAFQDIDNLLNLFTLLGAIGCFLFSFLQWMRRRPGLKALGLDLALLIGNLLIVGAVAVDILADAGILALDLEEIAIHVALIAAILVFGMTVAFLQPYVCET